LHGVNNLNEKGQSQSVGKNLLDTWGGRGRRDNANRCTRRDRQKKKMMRRKERRLFLSCPIEKGGASRDGHKTKWKKNVFVRKFKVPPNGQEGH